MRSLIIFIYIISFASIILSCNNSGKDEKSQNDTLVVQKNDVDGPRAAEIDCSTIGNFLISPEVADTMIKRFDTIFKRTGRPNEVKGLAKSFWIDSSVILAFQKFLKDSTEYDGARFYLGANKDSTEIVLVPTRPNPIDFPWHNANWKVKVPLLSNSNPLFKNYNLQHEYAITLRKKFEKDYRGERVPGEHPTGINDSLSKAVWFSKCVFDALANHLNNSAYRLDGIRIYCAAYNKKHPGTHQLKDIQSTFIIVVTKSDGSNGHLDDWEVLNRIYMNEEKFNRGGYNHGELCPTVCN